MAKNNLPAQAYAARASEGLKQLANRPDMSSANHVNMGVGSIVRNPDAGGAKTSGIKIRGTGAATKGTMARGPMA
ncbi:MAG: hypothetical protein ACO2ZF_13165 [Paracoccaceae bacterium]